MTRLEANEQILKCIDEYMHKFPELRFNQILQNMCIVEPGQDLWYEESEVTLTHVSSILKHTNKKIEL